MEHEQRIDRRPQEKRAQQRICYANKNMIPALKTIWQACFGDEMEYIDFYFKHRFTEDNMLVYCVDSKPVSMISLLPAQLVVEQKRIPVRYVYAVATLREYRKKGYARALIEAGYKHLEEALILEPASANLQKYYEKMGFKPAFYITEKMLAEAERGSKETGSLHTLQQQYWLLTITPLEYKRMRDAYFLEKLVDVSGQQENARKKITGYVEWDEAAVNYALLENDYNDGYAYKVQHHGREDFLLFREDTDKVLVLETSLSEDDLAAVMDKLQVKKSVVVRGAATQLNLKENEQGNRKDIAEVKTMGMILGWADALYGYLNLTLE